MKRSINTLIAEVTSIIHAYAFDAEGGGDEHWITLSNGARVLIDGEGKVVKGMGGKFDGQKVDELSENDSESGRYTMLPNGETVLIDLEGKKVIGGVSEEHVGKPIFEYIQAKQDEAEAAARKKEESKKSKPADSQADTIDKKSYGGYDMHKSDRELNTEAYDKYNGDEKKVKAEQLKISKQRDKYVDDNVKMFEKVGSERGWEGTDVSRSRQSMSTYVTLQREGYESVEIRFSDHEDRHFANAINLMTGSTAKENKQKLSAFLESQKPLGAEDAKGRGGAQGLIDSCIEVIRECVPDEILQEISLGCMKGGAEM